MSYDTWDVAGALNAGLEAVYLDRPPPEEIGPQPTLVVKSLVQVADLLQA